MPSGSDPRCSYPDCSGQPVWRGGGKIWCVIHSPDSNGLIKMEGNNAFPLSVPLSGELSGIGSGTLQTAIQQENKIRKISVENLLKMRARLNKRADELLLAKGNDYNAQQQESGDTLFNLRICAVLGIVPSPIQGILVRMSDKFARLISLTHPGVVQKVKDESLEDTVVDLRNYADYLLAMIRESKGQEIA